MARNTKKKLAIFAGTSKCLIYAEAKYCASEMPGEIKYYECSRTEYCCAFGCCVSPGLHFHHLWYYWILVIIMFLVCSGGGWWYRYWLQGRYRAAASAIPTRSSNNRPQNSLRNTPCQIQQARITYNSARNTVLLHRMWKGPQRNTAAPAYNSNATTSTHYQNMNVVSNDATCPYYQLYGPPPSYETVIAQTRGKISNPTSPESFAARMDLQAANVIPNPSVPQYFFYTCNSSPRLMDNSPSQCQSDNAISQLDNHANVPFAHFSQYCATSSAVTQNICVSLGYPDESATSGERNLSHGYQTTSQWLPAYPAERLSDASDTENAAVGYEPQNTEDYTTFNIDDATGSYREHGPWNAADESTSQVQDNVTVQGENQMSQRQCVTGADACISSLESQASGSNESELKHTSCTVSTSQRSFSRGHADCGGSLRLPRKYTGDCIYQGGNSQGIFPKDLSNSQRNASTFTRSVASDGATSHTSSSDKVAEADASSSQSNPSNNVILESFIFENASPPTEDVVEASSLCAMNRSTNFDLESKHKLDRSKSLD